MNENDTRAVSNVVSVVLVTFLVVLLVGVISAGIIGTSGELGQNTPLVDFRYEVLNDTIRITHMGGDSFLIADVIVVFEGIDGNETSPIPLETATFNETDGDDLFEVGELAILSHPVQSGKWVEITIIHEPTNSVISTEPNNFRVPK